MLPYWSAHHWVRYGRVRLLQRVGGGSLSYHKIHHHSTQAADGTIYLALCGAWVKSAFALAALAALVNGHSIVKCTIAHTQLEKAFYSPRGGNGRTF